MKIDRPGSCWYGALSCLSPADARQRSVTHGQAQSRQQNGLRLWAPCMMCMHSSGLVVFQGTASNSEAKAFLVFKPGARHHHFNHCQPSPPRCLGVPKARLTAALMQGAKPETSLRSSLLRAPVLLIPSPPFTFSSEGLSDGFCSEMFQFDLFVTTDAMAFIASVAVAKSLSAITALAVPLCRKTLHFKTSVHSSRLYNSHDRKTWRDQSQTPSPNHDRPVHPGADVGVLDPGLSGVEKPSELSLMV
jgi:hypothetical protein